MKTSLFRRVTSLLLLVLWAVEPGLVWAQTTTTNTSLTRYPQSIKEDLSFPTFVKVIDSPYAREAPFPSAQATSALTYGNLLVGNAGTSGTLAQSLLQVDADDARTSVFTSDIKAPIGLTFWDTGSPLVLKNGALTFNSQGEVTKIAAKSSVAVRISDGTSSTAGTTEELDKIDKGIAAIATVDSAGFYYGKADRLKLHVGNSGSAEENNNGDGSHRNDGEGEDDVQGRNYLVLFSKNGAFSNPLDMTFVQDANSPPGIGKLYVLDAGASLKIYSLTQINSRRFLATLKNAVTANLANPVSLKLQKSNNHLWITNRGDGSIVELDGNGGLIRKISTNLGGSQLWGLTFSETQQNTVETLYLTTTGGVGVTPNSTPQGKLLRLVLAPLEVVDPLPGVTTSVDAAGPVLFRVNQSIDARTLTNQVVTLTSSTGQNVPLGLSLSAPNVVSVAPQQPFVAGQTYTLTVRPGLADLYGNTLLQPFAAAYRATAPVNPNVPFSLTLTPLSAVAVPGSQANYALVATLLPGKNFSGLISLQAIGLPTGISASFEQGQIVPGQTTTLKLTVASSVPQSGVNVKVRGSSPVSGQTLSAESNTASLSVTGLGGNTVVYGRVLSAEVVPRPLINVIIRPYCKDASANVNTCNALDPSTISTTTDGSGYFVLSLPQGSPSLPPSGSQLILFVDGRGSSNATQQFAAAKTTLPVATGQWNTVPFDIHLPVILSGTTATNVPGGIQMESPAYPNTRILVPDGVRLYSYIEQKNVLPSEVQISAVDPGKLPQPLPNAVDTTMASTIQPGGTTAFDAAGNPTTIPVSYANLGHELPGTKLALWSVTRDDRWYQYGYGLVSEDGRRVEPKVCVDGELNAQTCAANGQKAGQAYGLVEFSWHFAQALSKPDQETNSPDCPCATEQSARPVDNATGTFYLTSTDMGVQGGRMPFVLTRSYRSLDRNLGSFGQGTSTNFDIAVQPTGSGVVQLILPKNARYLFSLSPTGTTYVNESELTFRGDTISRTSNGYLWRKKTGESLTFGNSGLLLAMADRNGNTIKINRFGNEDSTTIDSFSSVSGSLTISSTFVVSASGQTGRIIDSITDQGGRTVRYSYDAQYRLIRVTSPENTTWNYTYDPVTGFMATATDPRGNLYIKNTYDTAGRTIRQEHAEGVVYQWQYLQNNPTVVRGLVSQTRVTLPNGNVETYSFDGSRYPNGSTDALGQTMRLTRSTGTNEVTAFTDSIGRTEQVQCDGRGNVTRKLDAQGNARAVTYNSAYSLPTSITDSLGHISTLSYDSKGNAIRVADALGHGMSLQYDQYGQLLSAQNDVDGPTNFEYDQQGRITSLNAPLGRTSTATYDNLNRVISLTDALGRTTRLEYDNLNRIKKQTHADDTFIGMTYDANGNLTSLSDEKGNTTTYEYDGLNRLTRRTNSLGQFSLYQYDYNNNLTRSIDRKGQTTTFQYDKRDDLTRTTLVDGTSIERTYDAVGRLVALNDSHDGRIDWQYDVLDRAVAETTAQGTVEYSFDSEGRRLSLSAPQGYQVNYGYDVADRVTSITRSGRSFSMGYDAADRMTSLAMPNGVTTNNSFDSAGRLSRILYSKNAQAIKDLQYSYDATDQISRVEGTPSHTLGDTPVAATATNQNNQYTTFGAESLQYDANGNLTNKGQASYQWDVRDRLIGMTSAGLTASFSYGPLGRRAGKTVNGATTTFLYDVWDIIEDSTAQYTHGTGIDDVLERVEGGNSEYYLKDHLGSTIGLTDGNGNITVQYGYSAFGQATKAGTSGNYFTYTGREDDGTGLYYYRARYYSPALKRFASEDLIGFAGGDTNLQAYVGGNPISYIDPYGRGPLGTVVGGVFGGAIGALLGAGAGSLALPGGGTLGGGVVGVEQGAVIGAFLGSQIEDAFNRNPCPAVYVPNRPLPRDKSGVPIPDSEYPHTQLGERTSKRRGETYPQGREFGEDGRHVKDIDWTDHDPG